MERRGYCPEGKGGGRGGKERKVCMGLSYIWREKWEEGKDERREAESDGRV